MKNILLMSVVLLFACTALNTESDEEKVKLDFVDVTDGDTFNKKIRPLQNYRRTY